MAINRVCGRQVANWAASSTAQSPVTKRHWGAGELRLPPASEPRGAAAAAEPGQLARGAGRERCWAQGKWSVARPLSLSKADVTFTWHVQVVPGVAQISTLTLSRALGLQK